jgi:hypothetical protein
MCWPEHLHLSNLDPDEASPVLKLVQLLAAAASWLRFVPLVAKNRLCVPLSTSAGAIVELVHPAHTLPTGITQM